MPVPEMDLTDYLAAMRRFLNVPSDHISNEMGLSSGQLARVDSRESVCSIDRAQQYADILGINLSVTIETDEFRVTVPLYLKKTNDFPRQRPRGYKKNPTTPAAE